MQALAATHSYRFSMAGRHRTVIITGATTGVEAIMAAARIRPSSIIRFQAVQRRHQVQRPAVLAQRLHRVQDQVPEYKHPVRASTPTGSESFANRAIRSISADWRRTAVVLHSQSQQSLNGEVPRG